jgi:anti-sigma B factor antagonist
VERPHVNLTRVSGVTVVELIGEHDVSTAATLERALERVGPAEPCVVDLSAVTFIDSSILGVLVRTASRAGAPGRTAAAAPPGTVAARLFDLTRTASIVPVRASLEEAIAWCRSLAVEAGSL